MSASSSEHRCYSRYQSVGYLPQVETQTFETQVGRYDYNAVIRKYKERKIAVEDNSSAKNNRRSYRKFTKGASELSETIEERVF